MNENKEYLIELMARAMFIANPPRNMIAEDWDSGAILGKDNSVRREYLKMAKAAEAAIEMSQALDELIGMDQDLY